MNRGLCIIFTLPFFCLFLRCLEPMSTCRYDGDSLVLLSTRYSWQDISRPSLSFLRRDVFAFQFSLVTLFCPVHNSTSISYPQEQIEYLPSSADSYSHHLSSTLLTNFISCFFPLVIPPDFVQNDHSPTNRRRACTSAKGFRRSTTNTS